MTEEELKESTFDESVPLFKKWRSWYTLVIIVNIIIVSIVYFYFKSL